MNKNRLLGGTVLVATLLLAGCGNKGALYLPEPQKQLNPATHQDVEPVPEQSRE